MAMTLTEFVAATGAEIVGDRLILGERTDREFVGSIEGGTFVLNEKGQSILEDLEAGVAAQKQADLEKAVKASRKAKKDDVPAADAPAAASDDPLDIDVNV